MCSFGPGGGGGGRGGGSTQTNIVRLKINASNWRQPLSWNVYIGEGFFWGGGGGGRQWWCHYVIVFSQFKEGPKFRLLGWVLKLHLYVLELDACYFVLRNSNSMVEREAQSWISKKQRAGNFNEHDVKQQATIVVVFHHSFMGCVLRQKRRLQHPSGRECWRWLRQNVRRHQLDRTWNGA